MSLWESDEGYVHAGDTVGFSEYMYLAGKSCGLSTGVSVLVGT